MQNDDALSPGEFRFILSKFWEGKQSKAEAELLLADMLARIKRGKGEEGEGHLSDAMLEYMTLALSRYLSGDAKSLDHAFGLVAPAHRMPDVGKEDRNSLIVMVVLTCSGTKTLTEGRDADGTFREVGEIFNLSASQVRDIFYGKGAYQELAREAFTISQNYR